MNEPLVSIIVRTKDRPKLLKRALQSIAAQTYRPLEVVLVNDGGCDLDIEDLEGVLGDISLNYVRLEKNTGRAHAGNVGIENTKGEYVGFLDDDDEFYPDHVQTLVSFLQQSEYMVVYADTNMVYQEDAPDQGKTVVTDNVILSRDFSYYDLILGNYIPFNSVIFSRAVIDSFSIDESMDLFEDWDFLVRIAGTYPFHHVNKLTARYNQWSLSLQINRQETSHLRNLQLQIIDKYRDKIPSHLILRYYEDSLDKTTSIAKKDIHIKGLEEYIASLEALVDNKDVNIKGLEEHSAALHAVVDARDTFIKDLQSHVTTGELRLCEMERQIMDAQQRETSLYSELTKNRQALLDLEVRLADRENYIHHIHSGHGWRLLLKYFKAREAVLPEGSRRRHIFKYLFNAINPSRNDRNKEDAEKLRHKNGSVVTHPSTSPDGSYGVTDGKEPYEQWMERFEGPVINLEGQRSLRFRHEPKISIIVPTYNPDPQVFREMVESVLQQTYDNWELCIADGGSEEGRREAVRKCAEGEPRIKVTYLPENLGIADNSNAAFAMASGEFIALLDHDDTLARFALHEVVKAINENPAVDFIYSDRDMIDGTGRRFNPFFKPDWSPDYLLSQNYVCHLNVFRKTALNKTGGFRKGFDGSQDYDLVLRITELTNEIVHIPKILYHWRALPGSAALTGLDAKPYAKTAALNALQEAVNRRGWDGVVSQGEVEGLYRVQFRIKDTPKVSIIIPTKDKVDILRKCIDSIIKKTTYRNYEIAVVDNGSAEDKTFKYYEELRTNPAVRLLKYDQPFNFSEINNFGVSKTDGDYLLFLNNDTEIITEDWLEIMLGFAQRRETGAVGPKMLYPDGTIQLTGLILDENGGVRRGHWRFSRTSLGYGGRILGIHNVSAVAAACMMVRREVFEEVGRLDPCFVVAHGDIDFCLKLLDKGYLIVYEPHAELYHHESLTRGYEDSPEKVARLGRETDLLLDRWGAVLKRGDPYYNPNLSPEKDDFSIRT